MDKESTIIGIGIIALIIIPFVLVYLIKKSIQIKFQTTFRKFAEMEKIKLSEHEMWENHYLTGIDTESGKLIYLKKDAENAPVIINLSEVETCRVVTTDRSEKSRFGDKIPTNRLDLVFTLKKNNRAEPSIEFYNNPAFMPSPEACSVINKWADIVNSYLKKGIN